MKPHLSWIISLPHALQIVKKMGIKKHRDSGYRFELNEVKDQFNARWSSEKAVYADYGKDTVLYKLDIYYEKPDNEALTNKSSVSRRVRRK